LRIAEGSEKIARAAQTGWCARIAVSTANSAQAAHITIGMLQGCMLVLVRSGTRSERMWSLSRFK